jgi:hypothetical protein
MTVVPLEPVESVTVTTLIDNVIDALLHCLGTYNPWGSEPARLRS